MNYNLHFAIGNKEEIIRSVEDLDFDFFDKLQEEKKWADFDLHLIPDDLNLLVNAGTELKAMVSFGLRENLDTSKDYFDSEEAGAYSVSRKIIDLFSEFEINDAAILTEKWFEKIRDFHKDDIQVTEESVQAVRQLIEICKEAKSSNLDLMHLWYL